MSNIDLILIPFLCHFALILFLYVWLTFLRQKAVMNNEVAITDFVNANSDSDTSKRVARNLSNQFEIPIFAYLATFILINNNAIGTLDIVAGWVFLVGRLIHTYVQTLTMNIPLRGMVFTINFVAVVWLVGHMFWYFATN